MLKISEHNFNYYQYEVYWEYKIYYFVKGMNYKYMELINAMIIEEPIRNLKNVKTDSYNVTSL